MTLHSITSHRLAKEAEEARLAAERAAAILAAEQKEAEQLGLADDQVNMELYISRQCKFCLATGCACVDSGRMLSR